MFNNHTLVAKSSSIAEQFRVRFLKRAAHRRFVRSIRVLRNKNLQDLFPGIEKQRGIVKACVATTSAFGNPNPYETIVIATLCSYMKPSLVFEFGTYDGLTTLHLAINSPYDARILTIDLAPNDPLRDIECDDTFYTHGVVVGQHFDGVEEAQKIEQIYANTLDYDHTGLLAQVDLIFIDAGHDYKLVQSDSKKALDMIRPGGVILWHDYHFAHEGVYRYLNELSKQIILYYIEGTSFVCHVASD